MEPVQFQFFLSRFYSYFYCTKKLKSHYKVYTFFLRKKIKLQIKSIMYRDPNEIKAFKMYQKTKVILFILVLVLPFSFFLLYFDAVVTFLIFNIRDLTMLRFLFEFAWYKILIFSMIQYCVILLLSSIYYHVIKIIIKNKYFFLG